MLYTLAIKYNLGGFKMIKKKINAILIVIVLLLTLSATPTFASSRQTGSEWYPASGGWETTFNSSARVVQAILVPFTISNQWDVNELRAFALKVLRERDSDTTVQLTCTASYSGTAYTDAQNVAPGTYTLCLLVSVSGQSNPSIAYQREVVVKSGTLNVPVTSVALNKASIALKVSGIEMLTSTVAPDNATTKAVTWKSSDTKVATVENGKVTAKAKGTAIITVTTQDGNKTATCTVQVSAEPSTAVSSVELNKATIALEKGKTYTLKETIAPSTAKNKAVTWKSSNTKVATVKNGKVTAKAKGTTTITATTKDGAKKAICKVTVGVKSATRIKLNKTKVTLGRGKTLKPKATLMPKNANPTTITWKSSNTKIATVSKSGKITAKAKGTATITAFSWNGKKATCKVTVR